MIFRNKHVRELAWVIGSPPLLTGEKFVSQEWFRQKLIADHGFLSELDEQPVFFERFLQHKNPRRLGKYFEALLEFWFSHSSQFELVVSNLQIKEGKQTIGEFDFIVWEKESEQHLHFEVAVKFYMQFQHSLWHEHWIGPNTRDNLKLKFDKLLNRQIRLGETPQARLTLAEKGIERIEPKIILKGFHFYHWKDEKRVFPPTFHPEHLQAWWALYTEFIENIPPYRFFYSVEKHDWFSEPIIANENELLFGIKLRNWIMERMGVLPNGFMLIEFDPETRQELSRGFVVPDSWPAFAF